MFRFISYALSGLVCLSAWSCRPVDQSPDKIAEVDGAVVTHKELARTGGKALANAREQLYKLERQKLDEHIGATLLTREAQKRNLSVSTLLDQEVASKVPPVSDDDVQNFYQANKARLQVDFDKVRERIREYLQSQRYDARKGDFIAGLRAKANIKSYLKPPQVHRVEVTLAGAPSRGESSAPVTIVKFEDYHCPYCKTVQPRFSELIKKYAGKVRLVHKDLPLTELHPQARQAAEAARCAGDQGKFWEYHDKLYERSPKASASDLKIYAKEVGLNTDSFDGCYDKGKYRAAVQKDSSEGAALGLTGTPAFFINGRELIGAQPLEAFTAIIDDELALLAK